ncbi:MAG TPA: methyltransferase [Candidatus Limnocylindrales bacterium]|nr:methyltransferase [Candidatus Limnocylindrales bacterium]
MAPTTQAPTKHEPPNSAAETNPFQTLIMLAGGACLPRSLHVVAELGVADALDDEPRTAAQLAASVGAHADSLARVLRLLSSYGVFAIDGDKVRHTDASRLLRTDHPHSMRALGRMFGLNIFWDAFSELEHTVRTGVPATTKTLPEGTWAYFEKNPEAGHIFNGAMVSKAQAQMPAVVAGYDFSRFATIADIGGGRGHLLHAILESNPTARGILFDLPNVIKDAKGAASDRLKLHAGDFFKDPLPAADAYTIMEVIHDWADAESLAIFKAIRKAAKPGAKLLVIEQLVPNDSAPHWSKMLDIHMLTLLGGRQRTLEEYEALLRPAGFSDLRVHATRSDVSILEATASGA